jgi:flagellar assembly protein FliH
MSSSSEAAVRAGSAADPQPARLPDLRSGQWTRLGDDSVLGDRVTEVALGALAERTRDAARAQGYATGWAEGRQEALARATEVEAEAARRNAAAERRRDAEHADAVAALGEAADALLASVQDICARVADQATGLALELTRALVGHELAVTADPGQDVVRRVLAALPAGPVATVRLHPDLVTADVVAELDRHGLTVAGDASLSPGDAVVEADDAAVDLRVSTALERVAEVLR